MFFIPWEPALTRPELESLANPSYADEPEVVPWMLYDTAAIANATVGNVSMFTAQNADKTLSNLEGPGQLPDPQYFVVYYVAADILQIPTYTAAANEPNAAMANIENILKTSRCIVTINVSNKIYGPFPLAMCHSLGGETGIGYGYGAAALGDGQSLAIVNNGVPGRGGFPYSGALVIPPKVGFNVTLTFGVATTILVATVNLRITLVGSLYRRVL